MTFNQDELDEIREIARQYGVKFRFDGAIFPSFDNDNKPIDYRASSKFAFDKEMEDEKKISEWYEFYQRAKNFPKTDSLFKCGAGMSTFYVDSYGNLQPCLMVTSHSYNLAKGNFTEGWTKYIGYVRNIKMDKGLKCRDCEKIALCGYCPPFFQLETGVEDQCSSYLCELGHYRYEALQNFKGKTNKM